MGEATNTGSQSSKGAKAGAGKAKGSGGAQAKPQAPGAARPYVVLREVSMSAFESAEALRDALVLNAGVDGKVYVELGSATVKTPKEARRTVAKAKLSEDELRTEAGVPLRAVARGAFEAGIGVARLKVEPTWDD